MRRVFILVGLAAALVGLIYWALPTEEVAPTEPVQAATRAPENVLAAAKVSPAPVATPEIPVATDYRRAVAAALIERNDAETIVVAVALLLSDRRSTDFVTHRLERSREYAELLHRASMLAPNLPAVQWLALSLCDEMTRNQAPCAGAEFERALSEVDPDNGIRWFSMLGRAVAQADRAAQSEAIANLAESDGFRVYHATVEPLVFHAIESARVPAPRGNGFSAAEDAAISVIATLPLPDLKSLIETCNSPSRDLAKQCMQISKVLRKGDSYVLQAAGLNMAERLAAFGTIQASEIVDERRNLEWLVYQFGQLKPGPETTLRLLPEAGNEVDMWRAVLRENGIAPQPPLNWSRP